MQPGQRLPRHTGAAPEATDDGVHYPGTYVAGVYNRLVDAVDGVLLDHESLVNLPNWALLQFRTEGQDWFSMDRAEVLDHSLTLDMRKGQLVRELRFRDDAGRLTRVTQRRLIHGNDPHLAALETTFRPEGWSGAIEVRSSIDGDIENNGVARYHDLDGRHLRVEQLWAPEEDVVALVTETTGSHIRVAEAARTRVLGTRSPVERTLETGDARIGHRLVVPVVAGEEVVVEKVAAVYTSRDQGIYEPGEHAVRHVTCLVGYDELAISNTRGWAHVWRRTDIRIEESESLARGLTLQLFHLHQVISKHTTSLDVGVPARGLAGEAYRGHIFWDELFVFPYVNLRVPEHARALLMYRFRRLDEARRRAREAGFEGAMFPWQSASSGREETPEAHLNPRSGHWLPDHSRLQRHVNAAIAHNVVRYLDATADQDFLSFNGAELMVEIARFWASAATYDHIEDRVRDRGGGRPRRVPRGPARRRPPRRRQQRLHQRDGGLGPLEERGDPRPTRRPPAGGDRGQAGHHRRRTTTLEGASVGGCGSASTTGSSASSRATRSWRSWTGTPTGAAMATSSASTGSSRPRVTRPTATACRSRRTCSCCSTCSRRRRWSSSSTGSATRSTRR